MQQFEAEAHPEVLIAMRQTITSMLGTLPPQFFRVVISTEAENLAQLMYSVLMSGCAPGGRRRGDSGWLVRRWLAGGGGVHGPWRAGERARAATARGEGRARAGAAAPAGCARRENARAAAAASPQAPTSSQALTAPPPLHLARPAATCLPTPGRG